MKDLAGKWKRRVRSLLIPYLVWNTLYCLAYWAAGRIPRISAFINRPRMNLTWSGFARAVFLYEYNPVFWFMFQLLLLTALAPLIYLAVRKALTGWMLLILVMAGIRCGFSLPFLNLDALFYYSVAAFAAVRAGTWAEAEWTPRRGALGILLIVLGLMLLPLYHFRAVIPAVVACRCLVPAGLWLLVDERRLPGEKAWMGCTFFVYAFHFVPVRFINKAAALIFSGSRTAAALLFLMIPFAAFAICFAVSRLLKRYLPRTWRILNGGR